MKILLTHRFVAREARTPIPLMDLAAYGRHCGHEIDVAYEQGQSISADYDVIGLSALILDETTLDALRSIRQHYSGRLILGGKATATISETARAALAELDVEVFRGAGEKLLNGDMPIDYDNYPSWDVDDLRILGKASIGTELMSSRGCPYRCHFCHNTEPKIRLFTPERTVVNASLLLDTMKRPSIFFVDDIFALRASRMMAILAEADRVGLALRKRSHFFVHVSQIDNERLRAIDAFEPLELQVGIESGDDRMLKLMGKTFTAADAEECIKLLHAHGQRVACLFLMGFPDETRQSLQATVDFVVRNRKYMSGWWVSYYQPVPGTKGWDMARERGGEVTGGWNTEISYLDPNLTEDDLTTARHTIMTP